MKNLIRDSLRAISHKIEQFAKFLDSENRFKIVTTEYTESRRCLSFTFSNYKLKSDKDVLRAIFNTLMSNREFKAFGENKIIILSGIYENYEFNFHSNVYINNYTTFDEYYKTVNDKFEGIIDLNYQLSNIQIDKIPNFRVKVWNMDKFANRNITMTKNTVIFGPKIQARGYSSYIKPIRITNIDPSLKMFAAMDVETINWKGIQKPIAISLVYSLNNELKSKLFLIEPKLFIRASDFAINKLWNRVFDFIFKNPSNFEIIFTHNLGSFDGYFIYKALSNYFTDNPEKLSTIIDNQNKFITINIKLDKFKNIKWLDSNRIFPLSLDNLCKMFKVEGKVSKYNQEFNNMTLFDNVILLDEFKTYSIQDSIALYNALIKAQEYYSNNYCIDITSILSASSLSLKILRQQFLKQDIPILTQGEDNYIRKGYFGGATDIYRCYGENIHYYDVNSLYPYAMKNLMPFEIIKYYDNLSNMNLNDFFGYCLVKVTAPNDIQYSLLPYKHEGKTIYPIGMWKGVYFSELLKEVVKQGYKVELISGYEFSKFDLFSEYVDHFYEIKRNSPKDSPERFISKLHLNTPYGIFGRRKDLIQTLNVKNKNLKSYLLSRVVKSTIEINNQITTILIHNNLNPKIISELNSKFNTQFINNSTMVKSNVAIAGAVTSYAQIHMIKVKILCGELGIKIYYTDTDSIFTNKPLPSHLIGVDLGLMKDELNGLVIKQAYFLGIKEYGYTIEYSNKEIKEYSVWAGVKRNTISFSEITEMYEGKTIEKEVKNVFHKSLRKLDISIKDNQVSIKKLEFKKLKNNIYSPIKIYNIFCVDYIFKWIQRFIFKLQRILNKFNL